MVKAEFDLMSNPDCCSEGMFMILRTALAMQSRLVC